MTTDTLLAELVAIDSVNPVLVPGGAGEAEIAAYVAGWLAEHGLEVTVDEPRPGRPSVVGVARGTGGGRSLMLNAHLDTVTVEGMDRPHEPIVRDGRLYGRGAYDMKGGLAAIMAAGAAAASDRLSGDVIVTAVADEEHSSEGVQSVLRRWRADACVVTEPTHLSACVAHKGFVWAQLETQGRAAHGSRADLGVDAIVGMAPALAGIPVLQRRLDEATHPLLGSASLHASLISGGQELSSSRSAACWRSSAGRCPASRRRTSSASFQTCSRSRGRPTRAWGRAAMGLVREPFEVDPSAGIVTALRAAAARTLGAEPEIVGHKAWMDAAFIAAAGIPYVVFGPTGEGAHAIEEYVELESVRRWPRSSSRPPGASARKRAPRRALGSAPACRRDRGRVGM